MQIELQIIVFSKWKLNIIIIKFFYSLPICILCVCMCWSCWPEHSSLCSPEHRSSFTAYIRRCSRLLIRSHFVHRILFVSLLALLLLCFRFATLSFGSSKDQLLQHIQWFVIHSTVIIAKKLTNFINRF